VNKKWVFKELVKNDEDVIGLVAYALYKGEKSRLANSLRLDGQTEINITAELNVFHEQTISSQRLSKFKEQADKLFSGIINDIEEDLQKTYVKNEEDLQKTYTKKEKNLEKDVKKKFRAQFDALVVKETSMLMRVWNFFCSGAGPLFSSLIISALVFGLIIPLTSPEAIDTFAAILFEHITGKKPL
jgi:hypothetical protein